MEKKRGRYLDLVICGPDMSGTSTQIKGLIKYFRSLEMKVRDLRGTEIDALFHSKKFQDSLSKSWIKENYSNFQEFLKEVKECQPVTTVDPQNLLFYANELLSGGGTNQDLRVASMVNNSITTYVDPNSADVWVMEEPT